MFAFLGIYSSGFEAHNYDIVVDIAKDSDLFVVCNKLAFSLGYVDGIDGRISPSMFLDLLMQPVEGFEPRPVALVNFDSLLISDKQFGLELISSLTQMIVGYREIGVRWRFDVFLNG